MSEPKEPVAKSLPERMIRIRSRWIAMGMEVLKCPNSIKKIPWKTVRCTSFTRYAKWSGPQLVAVQPDG